MTVRKLSTKVRKKRTIYDPPEGWRYGFPKSYNPLPGETFEDTLRRDGYPDRLMEVANISARFWEVDNL